MKPNRKEEDSPLPDDDLETLPFLDEFDEDTGHALVRVTHERSSDAGYDLALTINVAAMEKDEVPDAIEVPLATAIAEIGEALRWQRLLVLFTGAALIPSAANRRVGELLAEAKALSVTVRRGYGDEVVHTGQRPRVALKRRAGGAPDSVLVDVGGDVETADLAAALAAELESLRADAAGKSFAFAFSTGAAPDAATRKLLRDVLGGAGAARVTIAAGSAASETLVDRALAAKAVLRPSSRAGIDSEIDLRGAGDDGAAALELVLANADLGGKSLRVDFGNRTASDAEIAVLARAAVKHAPRRVELTAAGHAVDVLWPPLLDASRLGKQTALVVRPEGRDHAGVATAFVRETAHLSSELTGRQVTVAWPADFAFDAELEKTCIQEALAAHHPGRVICTFGGDNAEPMLPLPVTVDTEAGTLICRINTDAGAPVELVRAIARRIPAARTRLAGQRLTVHITGSGALSRSMRRALRDALTSAGATHVTLHDHGTSEVLLPPLLAIEPLSPTELDVTVNPGGRTAAEIDSAAATELDAAELPLAASVRLRGPADAAVVAALVARGVARIRLEDSGGVQVHPPLFAAPARDGGGLTLIASPAAGDDTTRLQVERELPAILAAQGDLGDVEITVRWPASNLPERVSGLLIAARPAAVIHVDDHEATTLLYPEPDALEAADDEMDFGDALFDDDDVGGSAAPATPAERPLAPAPAPAESAPSAAPRPAVSVLARKTDGDPPMIMLGIEWRADAAAMATIERELEDLREQVTGRRTLVVFHHQRRQFGGPERHPLVIAVRRALEPRVAALLVFREARGLGGIAHFQVVASRLEGLAVGSRMKDPRTRR